MAERPKQNTTPFVARDRDIERPLPQNLEAERSILGAVLLDSKALDVAAKQIRAEDFFFPLHRRIFLAMIQLRGPDVVIDSVLLVDALSRSEELDAEAAAYISTLTNGLPRATNVEHYARIIKRKSVLRNLAYCADSIVEQALTASDDDIDVVLDQAREALAAVDSTGPQGRSLICVDVTKFISGELPRRRALLEPFLHEKSIGMLHAWRGVGKTHLLEGMGLAVATGGRFLKWSAPEAVPVLLVDGEMADADLQDWLREATNAEGISPLREGFLRLIASDLQEGTLPSLLSAEGQRLIESKIENARLLILDNISSLFRGGTERADEDWAAAQEWLLTLRRNGVASALGHHDGKALVQRGTSKREDVMNWVLHMKRPGNYAPEDGLRAEIHFEKCRTLVGAEASPFEVQLVTHDGKPTWTVKNLTEAMIATIKQMHDQQGKSFAEIGKELGISKGWAKKLYDRA